MTGNTNAATTVKGFHFQDVCALYLFLENIKKIESFAVEGKEDIVLNWQNGTKSFIQSKETIYPYDGFDSAVMKRALNVLLEDLDKYPQDKIKNIAILTNSHHPFGKEKGNPFDISSYSFFEYNDLPSEMKDKIDDWISSLTDNEVDNSLLRIIKIEYAGSDDKTKLALLRQSVEQFMNSAQIMNAKYKTLMDSWIAMVSRSAEEEKKVITKDEFADQSTLIYSSSNSKGKTSLVRLILYALGYPIPSTNKMDFSKLETQIEIFENNKYLRLSRKDALLKIDTGKGDNLIFNLPDEQSEVIAVITDIGEPKVAENILGMTYFDQEKGWTLLNRGIVIGKYRFGIESLLDGLNSLDLTAIKDDLKVQKNNRKFYLQIKKLVEIKDERQNNISDIDWSSIDELQNELRTTTMKFNRLKTKINNLQSVADNNEKFSKLLEKMKIVIQIEGIKEILSSKNIVDYEFNRSLIMAQLTRQKNKLKLVLREKKRIEKEINNRMDLVNVDSQIDRFNQQISKINISISSIDNQLKINQKEIDRLQTLIKNCLVQTPQIQKIYDTLVEFANVLGVEDTLESTRNFIFTNNLKVYSGAKLHLLVFGFRLAVLKVVQDQLGKKYPIIIDSPMAGEVDEYNEKKMFELLDRYFFDNQIIVASIYDFKRSWNKRITMHNGVLDY
ncbi:coiled-coil domain-containing protein [Pediococcus pentosaceus]|uniref:coiled-coil domain-containing protein n=1 Tax=Pediococcus pentosaceus TaxID=1255 RepID=UPI00223AF32E|nr:hypothetical protein [Pediococcus pentosaceus]MCT1176485.1 hypothetical protein [Pediococcus pentosaceus]